MVKKISITRMTTKPPWHRENGNVCLVSTHTWEHKNINSKERTRIFRGPLNLVHVNINYIFVEYFIDFLIEDKTDMERII